MKNKKLFAILTLVCFLMTLMPVAAFAGVDADVIAADRCVVELTGDKAVEVKDPVELTFITRDNADAVTAGNGYVHVWATEGDKVSSALVGAKDNVVSTPFKAADESFETVLNVQFARAGEYKLHAAYSKNPTAKVADLTPAMGSGEIVVTVAAKEINTDGYAVAVAGDTDILANNLNNKLTLTFTDNGKALAKKAVAFKAPAGLTVTADADKTSYTGTMDVKVAASRAGVYTVNATIDGKKLSFNVNAEGTAAVKVATKAQPENLIALNANFDPEDVAEFELRDINNNVVKEAIDVVELEAPAKSALKADDFVVGVDGVLALEGADGFDKEGKYTVTVALENGSSAKASWEVKKVGDPVKIELDVPATVVLGDSFDVAAKYVDANGMETVAKIEKDVTFYATGRAIKTIGDKTVTVSDDEKYLGQEVVVNLIDKANDLTATAKVKIVEDSRNIAFDDVTLETYTSNEVEWNIVDAEGNEVEVTSGYGLDINYYVLNKPADANVNIQDSEMEYGKFKGHDTMVISCDKPGTVTVQVVAKVIKGVNAQYYVGTKVFAVGGAAVGDVVVMTIGTQTLVKNGQVTTMDATPIIKDNRTFVPFRALAEAFGAVVDYNEADKTITAELAGSTVVMTIGSNAYTVNGAEKTMDVAPYIDGERTMVPVRFVAEAFGIDVTAVPDVTDGTTASVIFNK